MRDKSKVRVEVELPARAEGCASVEYRLNNIHFHTASEHTFNGSQKNLEIHLSHDRTLDSKSCDNFPDALVVALLVEADILEFEDNIFLFELNLQQYADQRAKMAQFRALQPYYPSQVSGKALLSAYVPDVFKEKGFYIYSGSASQPGCEQDVLWVVLGEPLSMTSQQFNLFSAQMNNPSYREVQPLNKRNITFSSRVTSAAARLRS